MSENTNDFTAAGTSRRTVLKAAAWAAPAVAVVAAAPIAAAASGDPEPVPTGATITAANFGAQRGARIGLVDDDFEPVPFPAGTTIELTVTGEGTLADVRNVTGGAFSPAITDLVAGTYTVNATGGAANFTFRGDLTGSLTIVAKVTYGPNAGDTVTSQAATLSA